MKLKKYCIIQGLKPRFTCISLEQLVFSVCSINELRDFTTVLAEHLLVKALKQDGDCRKVAECS